MLDMIIRCGGKDKTDFVFYNTGLEYQATHEHLDYLENKYDIRIIKCKPNKAIPTCVREYGVPFWSKFASDMIRRLQMHGFKWEDKPFEELLEEYPKCRAALKWWCNVRHGNTTQYTIERAPYMKEFLIENPPDFKIANMCCEHAKKNPAHKIMNSGGYDLVCTGVRKAENGVRASVYKNCFSEKSDEADQFRPVFWLRDSDKEEYCNHYGVIHSRCYSEYGLRRTGCVGCPYGKLYGEELNVLQEYEPKLYKAALSVFGKSYEYTQKYLEYRERKKAENKK